MRRKDSFTNLLSMKQMNAGGLGVGLAYIPDLRTRVH